MSKESTIQFAGYITQLGPEEFTEQWEHYAKRKGNASGGMVLQHAMGKKARYQYVSQQEHGESDAGFDFTGKGFGYFHDRRVKVEQTGGYLPLQVQCREYDENTDLKVIAFLRHGDAGLDFYRTLPCHYLNIYQAYYENCLYGYVLEFFIAEAALGELLRELRERAAVEVGGYRKCGMLQV